MNELFAPFLYDRPRLVTAVALLLLFLLAFLIIIIQNYRRRQRLLLAFHDSWHGRVQADPSQPRGNSFRFVPAPDPFRSLQVELLRTWNTHFLIWRGKLQQHPQQELIWQRGLPPARGLTRNADVGLWVLRRIDLVDGDFAVRGNNSAALEHAFFDMQARFGAFIQQIVVQAEGENEIELTVKLNRFNAEDIPALLATLRAVARSALR